MLLLGEPHELATCSRLSWLSELMTITPAKKARQAASRCEQMFYKLHLAQSGYLLLQSAGREEVSLQNRASVSHPCDMLGPFIMALPSC